MTIINEEVKQSRPLSASLDSLHDIPEFNASKLREMITAASAQANAGAEVSPMQQIPAPFRRLARLAGKSIVFFFSFITAKQRDFNTIILQVLNVITDSLEKAVNGRTATLRQENVASHEVAIDELQKQLAALIARLTLQERRTAVLLEQLGGRQFPSPDNEQIQCPNNEKKHVLDAMYLAFEDQFRGSRDLIKERVREYLPLLRSAGVGVSEMSVLDVGCGRGEWLELLKEEGIQAEGIDLNRLMVEQCCQRGLNVVESDVISYLRNLPDASVDVVTGFHIIEHLPFEVLVDLFDETLRVLKSGGLALFETPNPQNLIVGSWYFYLDPTHRNPLPSPTVKFLAEARGFSRVEIINLHSADVPELDEATEVAKRFNEYFCGPMDYAVVAWRV